MQNPVQGRKFKPGVYARLNDMRFGYLTVLSRAGHRGKFAAWLCRCDCGVEKVVGGQHLRRGKIRSCNTNGHRWKQARPQLGLTAQFPSEYQSWTNMRARCLDPKNAKYPIYGARGITIDHRWSEFKNFMLDMGRKPDPKFTIEREDVNGNYEPKNCHWISRKDQGRNKRNSVFVTYNGKRMLLIDLVEDLGLSRSIVYGRLKGGWTLAQAIALPIAVTKPRGPHRKNKRNKKPVAKRNDVVVDMDNVSDELLKHWPVE
jgi:hypothetical protein